MSDDKISVVELYKIKYKILNAERGDSFIKIDDEELFITDVGYALDGIRIFFDVLERYLFEERKSENESRTDRN